MKTLQAIIESYMGTVYDKGVDKLSKKEVVFFNAHNLQEELKDYFLSLAPEMLVNESDDSIEKYIAKGSYNDAISEYKENIKNG
jgi:hypothetical protein